MAKSGYTKDLKDIKLREEAKRINLKGYVQWNDGSINLYSTRKIAMKELRRDIAKNPRKR